MKKKGPRKLREAGITPQPEAAPPPSPVPVEEVIAQTMRGMGGILGAYAEGWKILKMRLDETDRHVKMVEDHLTAIQEEMNGKRIIVPGS